MIYIFIDKPNKLSGLYSIFLLSEYNQKVIDLIQQCTVAKFDKKTSLWEISLIDLSFLLDNLTYIDDIQLLLPKDEEKKEIIDPQFKDEYKTKPFPYQLEAIKYGINHDKWLLLDEMGLGKSLSMIDIAYELKRQNKIEHCLIICGINTIKTNWRKEINLHSNLSCRILGQKLGKSGSKKGKLLSTYKSIKERAEELREPIDEFFIITNIESFRDDKMVEAFNNSKNKIDMIILDECHKCKNPITRGDKACQQSTNLLKLDAKYKIAATGTLLLNNPIDSLIPLRWIGLEHSTLTDFKKYYCIQDDLYRIISYKNLDILKEEIESCSLRRTKEILKDQLPSKIIINEYVDMNESHRKLYDMIEKGIKDEIKETIDKVNIDTRSLLGMVVRLRQASVLPSILTSQNIESSKLERALDLIEQILNNNEKVVVFSTFKEPCYILANKLKQYNPLVVTGDTKDNLISQMIDQFNEDPNYKIFICTIAKCGTGLSLHKQCSNAIFLDCDWTAGLQSQAEDRINRLGSKNTAVIYRLICNDTIDEMVAYILKKKEAISNYILDSQKELAEDEINLLKKYILDL